MTMCSLSLAAHASIPPERGRFAVYIDATRAELSKLTSLTAIWWTLAGTITLTVVLSMLFIREAQFSIGAEATANAVGVLDVGVAAIGWSQIGFFLIGVMASTSEYIGGQVRTTLIAMPDRVLQRLAANTALTVVVIGAALLTVAVSISTTLIASGTRISELDAGLIARIAVSAAGYLACMALLSSGLGTLIRKAVPTAAILLIYLLILSPLLQSQQWYFLPDMASYALWYVTIPPGAPPAVVCWLVIVAWTLAAVVPAMLVFSRRDT